MSFSEDYYQVSFTPFAERYYKKTLEKRYKSHWLVTEKAIYEALARLAGLSKTDKFETIMCSNGADFYICKYFFKVAGRNESAKTMGTRAIVFVNNLEKTAQVLLIYSKNEIGKHNETQEWKKIVSNQYPEFWCLFGS